MNLADSERMAGVLEAAGYACAEDANDADVLVYNTCSIRDKAEQKVYSALGRQVRRQATVSAELQSWQSYHFDEIFSHEQKFSMLRGERHEIFPSLPPLPLR